MTKHIGLFIILDIFIYNREIISVYCIKTQSKFNNGFLSQKLIKNCFITYNSNSYK